MPIYEYKCKKCGKIKEEFKKFDDPPPCCCNEDMERLLSNCSFTLNGSGWFRDGYISKKEAKK